MKRNVIRIFAIFMIIVLSITNKVICADNEDIENEFESSSIFVETSDIDYVFNDENIENITEVADELYVVEYKDYQSAEDGYSKLNNDEKVDSVFKDIEVTIFENTFEDLEFEAFRVNKEYEAWGVSSTGMDNYTNYLKYKTKPTILVGVLDTGIYKYHEVFKSNKTADRVITDNSHNYVSGTTDVSDNQGHGTMVSSVIAECTPDNVKIVPIKILGSNGRGSLANIINALTDFKDKVDIFNMSLGIEAADITDEQKEGVEKILKEIYDNGNGPIMVCAAGNAGVNQVSYPASSEYTLAVSAVYQMSTGVSWANFSDYGNEIDFSAPGADLILADYQYDSGYVTGCNGTSAAAPFVTSALAVLKSEYPAVSNHELIELLKMNVDDLGVSGKDQFYGYGSVNFNSKLFESPKISRIYQYEITDTTSSIIVNCVGNDNVVKFAYKKYGSEPTSSDWKTVSNPSKDVQVDFKVNENGKYNVYIMDSDGDIASSTFTVTEIGANLPTIIPVSSIKLNKTTATITKTKTVSLSATVYPTNATNKAVTWSSSNSNIASVDKNGKVTGKGVGTATITAKAEDKTATCKVTVNARTPSVKYRTHVQNIGWQGYVQNGATSGTSGKSLRLDAINISIDSLDLAGNVEYRTHVENIGWQGYVKNGAMSGTSGRSLRLEAIQIKLTGDISKYYDIYYRVHCQNFGWLGWAKNGAQAGSAGYGYRLEAIQIKIVKKGESAPGSTANCFHQAPPNVYYRTHVQNVGWQGYVKDGQMSGTTGQSLRLEGINIFLNNLPTSGGIEYSTHVQNIGWQGFVKNGAMAGTEGRSLRLEAIKIRLTGDFANKYDIYYRVHCQNFGWLGWAKNGQEAGSAGYSYRLEGIQIKLVKKGGAAPGSTSNRFKQR